MYANVSYLRNTALVDSFAPEKGYVTSRGRLRRFADNVLLMPSKIGAAVSTSENYSMSHFLQLGKHVRLPSAISARRGVVLGLSMLGFLVVGGLLIFVSRREWFIPCYVAGYVVLLCSTPWPGQFERYLMPLAPCFVLCLFQALLFITRRSNRLRFRRWRFSGGVFIVTILCAILVMQAMTLYSMYSDGLQRVTHHDRHGRTMEYQQFYYSSAYRDLDEALDWLMVHGDPGQVVAGAWPHWIYLRTGFKAVLPPFEVDSAKAQRLLDTVPVKYLILGLDHDVLGINRYMLPVLEQEPGKWQQIFSTRDGKALIYEDRSRSTH